MITLHDFAKRPKLSDGQNENVQATPAQHNGNVPATPTQHKENMPATPTQHNENVPATPAQQNLNILTEAPGNSQKIFLEDKSEKIK